MSNLLTIVLLLSLSAITYQDFKERQVHWILFPLAFFLSILNSIQQVSADKLLLNSGSNVILIVILFLILFLYAKIRFKGRKGLWQLIGLGDLLFFVVASVNFAILNFIAFSIVSLFLSLIISLLYRHKTIPLAGIQACCLFLLLSMQYSFEFNLFNEYWIYQWI